MVFYVNTHDALNKTQFYRWRFEEIWEYQAAYNSALVVENDSVKLRKENINTCWASNKSGSILLGSTVKLSADAIKDLPLNVVPVSTNKLFFKYSLLVKQYGLTRPAYEYWSELSKSTQLTGSLFDPQPGQVTGNIHNISDPSELVFGYFSASTEVTKRITVAPRLGVIPRCDQLDTIPILCTGRDEDPCAFNTKKMLLTYFGPRSEYVIVAPPDCADCRLAGGKNKRPAFW